MKRTMDSTTTPHEPLIHPMTSKEPVVENVGLTTKATIIWLVVAVLLGGASGFIYKKVSSSMGGTSSSPSQISNKKATEIVGVKGKKNFKDQAEGVLKKCGIEGEGSHHLERPGGESQNVYLTSSTVDLSQFENKKVRVHGETFTAQTAGWLMDVGLVEVLE